MTSPDGEEVPHPQLIEAAGVALLEATVCVNIAREIRRNAADLGHDHPWSRKLAGRACEWEALASHVEDHLATPADLAESPEAPHLHLVR